MATTTENLGLALPAGTDRAEISVLNENFQTLDTFAGQATDDIQQAQETANAAAPQSTTYTKTEVDTALAAKLNTADVDDTLSETSANPVQNKVVQAPVARLVDAGAKNFMPLDTATFLSGGVGNEFAVKIPIGDYVLSCNCSATSSTSHLYLFDANHNEILHQPFTNSANKKINLSLASEAVLARFDSDISNTISKIMICTTTDYAISPEFVPYAPSNRELYEAKADKSIVGLKLVAFNTMESSSTFTYAMNKNDFIESSPDLARSVGTYIISIMPWSTSPNYSVYAVSYTCGSFNYTSIVKIAGEDRQITVEDGVISVSGLPNAGGKISIHALQ